MGWQPGSTYFNFGSSYTTDQLQEQPAEVDLNVGRPTGRYRRPTASWRASSRTA
jgi:hypothetical protein